MLLFQQFFFLYIRLRGRSGINLFSFRPVVNFLTVPFTLSYNKAFLMKNDFIQDTNLKFSSCIEFLQSVQSFLSVHFRSHTFTILKKYVS